MPIKRPNWAAGQTVTLEHHSHVLADNPLGDPSVRKLAVWLPPQYHLPRHRNRRFPVLFDFAGFTSSGLAHTNWKNFGENVAERAARLIHEGRMAPAILVFPDCFTALGGNQYINSSAIGAYADYLTRELIPFIDREFRTLATREHRACFGHSSGGYGAIVHGMKYPKFWGAVANHSGDAYFDFVYRNAWPDTLNVLARFAQPRLEGSIDVLARERGVEQGLDDGRIKNFLASFWKSTKAGNVDTLMNLCMAASYDPDPTAPNGFRVPFNMETGELIESRWKTWLKHDPIHLVQRHAASLKRLKGIYIDCGWTDQYQIHFGTRILSKRLALHGIKHVYEEFPDNHSGVDYRLDHSLPFLTKALAA